MWLNQFLIKEKKFHLFIAGRDEMNGKIKEVIQENNLDKVVTHLGFIKDIDKYFQSSDIFILPSIEREGCPTSILEAMSYAKPTIAFNIDGIPELIKNEEQGFLIDAYNYKDFQKALLSLLENKSLRRKWASQHYQDKKKYLILINLPPNTYNVLSVLLVIIINKVLILL